MLGSLGGMSYRSPYGAISSIFKSISNSIRHGDGDGDHKDDDDDGGGGGVADDKSWRVG